MSYVEAVRVVEAQEESVLIEASFEPLGDKMFWEKDGVCYSRQAALQKALRKLQEEDGVYPFDRI